MEESIQLKSEGANIMGNKDTNNEEQLEEVIEEEIEKRLGETSVEDEAAKDSTVAPVQYDISSYGADYDVEGLVNRLKRKDIKIPEFQRQYIWTIREASKFIESLLLGLPVPAIFLVREKNSNKMSVIDGQQRLKTLEYFYNGVFNPKEDEKKHQVFELVGVQNKFEGKTIEDLDENDKTKLNDSLIHAIIVKQESPKDDDTSIYYIFDRLNSKGRRLTPQEIRTAVYHGGFIDLLKDLNKVPQWRNIYGKPSNRLKDQELILRFLAMYYNDYSLYTKPMAEFLNKFLEKNRDPSDDFQTRIRETFTKTIDIIWNSIGKRAFRPLNSINAAVFDSIMLGVALRNKNDKPINTDALKIAYDSLLKDEDYLKLISQSTSDENTLKARMQKTVEVFSGV